MESNRGTYAVERRIVVKKVVGIMTTSSGWQGTYRCNYGAALQGYALIKQLRLLGYEAYDINYYSDNEYSPQKYSPIERTLRRLILLTNFKVVHGKLIEIKNRKGLGILTSKFREFVVKNDLTYNQGQFYRISRKNEKENTKLNTFNRYNSRICRGNRGGF